MTDGETIYAWFGTGQLVALGRDGTVRWQRHLGKEISPFDIQWGHSSSPVIYRDLVILLCDHPSAWYVLAVDKRTGKIDGRPIAEAGRSSYSTPLVIEGATRAELIVNSTERIDAYDPATGKLLWFTRRGQPLPGSHAGCRRRDHLRQPRLPQRSLHGDPDRR